MMIVFVKMKITTIMVSFNLPLSLRIITMLIVMAITMTAIPRLETC